MGEPFEQGGVHLDGGRGLNPQLAQVLGLFNGEPPLQLDHRTNKISHKDVALLIRVCIANRHDTRHEDPAIDANTRFALYRVARTGLGQDWGALAAISPGWDDDVPPAERLRRVTVFAL